METMQPDFFLIPNVVRNDKSLRPSDWMVYAVVYWFEKMRDGHCIASNRTIAASGGMGERAVSAGLERLEAAGFIRRTFKDDSHKHRLQIFALVSFSKTTMPLFTDEIDSTTVPSSDSRQHSCAVTDSTTVRQIKNNTEQPKTTATTSVAKFTALGADVLKALESVDPKNKNYYNNTSQRAAADFLVSQYGFEEVKKRIGVLAKTNKIPYFPSITTPVQLRDKWVQLQDAVDRKRGELSSKKVKII